jgi:hypothetical protein
MWVLIGDGPNDVQIPALVWTDKEKALKDCVEIFGREPDRKSGGGFLESFRWSIEEENEENEKLFAKMYTSYYGGCGECYRATLKHVEEGKPFVAFD